MKLNCIAIDDSANALELIRSHIEKIPFLNLLGTFQSGIDALETINHFNVELIFTDIQMPAISGMDFTKGLRGDSMIIFTTAYSEYAVEGYEINTIDYLLKPISFEKFFEAANKAYKRYKLFSRENMPNLSSLNDDNEYILFKSGNDFQRVNLNEILFLESKGNYMKVQLSNNTHFRCLMSMNEALEIIKEGRFLRCHRGFIVSLNHISKVSVNELSIKEYKVAVGKKYREHLKRALGI